MIASKAYKMIAETAITSKTVENLAVEIVVTVPFLIVVRACKKVPERGAYSVSVFSVRVAVGIYNGKEG